MGVRKLFPPGKEERVRDGRQEGVSPLREESELSSDGHSPLGGSRQALWCRSRARAVATGASRPRPRPRMVASWGPVGRQACEGGLPRRAPARQGRSFLPHPAPFWVGEVPLPLGGSVGGVEGSQEALGQAAVGWVVGCQSGGPWVSRDGVSGGVLSSQTVSELPLAGLSVRFPAKVQLTGRGAGQAGAPTPPLSVVNAWEFSPGPPRNLSLGRTPVASCHSPGRAAPHTGSFWSTCTLTM